jgi:hypothetical protein
MRRVYLFAISRFGRERDMLKTNRAANTAGFAFTDAKHAERKYSGLVECAIVSIAGLAVTLLLIAQGFLPTAM